MNDLRCYESISRLQAVRSFLANLLPEARAMTQAQMIVSTLMTSPILSVTVHTPLDAAYQMMAARRISSVPVLDEDDKPLGVLSMTDLLRIGRMQPASLAGIQPLELPSEPAGEHMHKGIITIAPEGSAIDAAKLMVENHVHRVYVEEAGKIIGVLSIEDLLVAVRGLHLDQEIGEIMTKPVIAIPVTTTIREAATKLDRVGITGIAVVDEYKHPVGMFTQVEALAAREISPDEPVEKVMSYGVLHQHVKTPLYRAAAHAYEARARRVLVMENGDLCGVVTGLDFARALVRSAAE